jgi:hypothetical protein
MKRLEQIEEELEALGGAGALTDNLPVRRPEHAPDIERSPDLEAWSHTVAAAVVKAVWATPLEADADDQFRRSSRARYLRELATPIEFDPPPRPRPEPETTAPPSWAWAANRSVS